MARRNDYQYVDLKNFLEKSQTDFKGIEFDIFRKDAGLNNFTLTQRKWVEATDAIGILSKSGKYGGTYAHKDIAFEFGTCISPELKLLLIQEFQRLKDVEAKQE